MSQPDPKHDQPQAKPDWPPGFTPQAGLKPPPGSAAAWSAPTAAVETAYVWTWGRIIVGAFAVSCLVVVIILMLTPFGRYREGDRRSRCGKLINQIATAQNVYATDRNQRGLPEAFILGTEAFCYPEGMKPPEPAGGTDASRAFVYMVKMRLLDRLSMLACPSDPFVAALDGSDKDLSRNDVDIPTEGTAVLAQWASPDSPARTEAGHTYFSYSMQSGSSVPQAMLGPNISAKIPIVGERNPWCVASILTTVGSPTRDSPEGNSWNHNREGVTLSFADGHNTFLTAANELEMPITPNPAAGEQPAFAYLYSDRPPTRPKASPRDGRCVPAGTAARTSNFTAWLTD